MSEQAQTVSKADNLKNIEAVRDLFARAHDYVAQATYPGHMGMKVAEVMQFLAFHHADFKNRADELAKQIEAEKKAATNVVDVPAAQAAIDAVLVDEHGSYESGQSVETPKA